MTVLIKADQLKDELIDVLSRDEVDYGKVQSLSTTLAKLDPEFVRFSADAALISRLGRELVARQETAVSELVKNAYDADATEVSLLFVDTDEPGGRLEVTDNGSGMTREQLINGFMRLSSSEKIAEPISPRYARQRAGRKGIGRFAVQRLGKTLSLITQTKEALKALRITIDWTKFETGEDLGSVASRIEEAPKQREGTTLILDGLRDAWDEAAIRRVYRYIFDLIQPFPLSLEGFSNLQDPGFKVYVARENKGEFKRIADEQSEILQHALAEISGYVDGEGVGHWSLFSQKLGIEEAKVKLGKTSEVSSSSFEHLRDVYFKAYYFIYDDNLLPRSQKRMIQDLAKERAGIRLYRNGFRVPPYGDRDDDWLGLDELYGKRYLLVPVRNLNFFGFAEIHDVEGNVFEETSSREGLLNNRAFEELRDFIFRSIQSAVLRVAEARGKKRRANQKETSTDPDVVMSKALKSIDKTVKNLADAGQAEQAKQLRAVSKHLKVATSVQKEQSQAILEELSMLRVLASLGLTIGEFTHEVSQTLGAASLASQQLFNTIQNAEEKEIARDVVYNVQRFKTYASYFAKAVADNVRRELIPQDLVQVAREFIETLRPSAERSGICLEKLMVTGQNLLTRPMHPSEWGSILFNFYTNSRKAIRRAGSQGKIQLQVGQEGDNVYLEFADNGDGIAPENRERIFNAFFATTSAAGRNASDYDELQGTGLGLKIVSDIVTSYGGKVFVTTPPSGYTTCLRVEIPRAVSEEVSSYGN